MRVAVLDGYIDEPSSLGVPPFIAPLPRYTLGAALDAGADAFYLTIDDWRDRTDRWERAERADILVVVAGAVVPGKYLAAMPVSPREIVELARHQGVTILGGACASAGMAPRGKGASISPEELNDAYDHVFTGDLDAAVHDLLKGEDGARRRTEPEWASWAVQGAAAVSERGDLPRMVAELDASIGCVHYISGGCSFCSEPAYGEPVFREPDDLRREAEALSRAGVRHFRLGGTADIMSYRAKGVGEVERPEPDPSMVNALLGAVASVDPKVFHLDNADPGIIAEHPGPAREVLSDIVSHCTAGNVLSLGLESADPAVRKANNLNATADEALIAIRMMNEVGSERGGTGMPRLLPGLNFITGLRGESAGTLKLNMEFLGTVLEERLMVRRINVRQVVWPGRGPGGSRIAWKFRDAVRETIDRPMLERVVPQGTVLRDVFPEVAIGKTWFGRQAGSYPILIGFPYDLSGIDRLDAAVVSHGPRSLTAVQYPLDINSAPMGAISALPGLGRKRAARLVRARPFTDLGSAAQALDEPPVLDPLKRLLVTGKSNI